MELYLSPVRTPNEWFQTHLDLINIGYSRTETSWCSAVEEQFLRLQGVLLELADLSLPEPRSDQLNATHSVHDPGIFDYDLDDRRRDLHVAARLLRQGKDAMANSGRSFLLRDVTETDTDFGAAWRTVKAIVGEFLEIGPRVDHVDSGYVPNDLDNVRCIVTSPAGLDGEPIVHLRLRYYPMGELAVESSCVTVFGAERLSQTWYAGNESWADGYPPDHHRVRGHVQQLVTVLRCMESHLGQTGVSTRSSRGSPGSESVRFTHRSESFYPFAQCTKPHEPLPGCILEDVSQLRRETEGLHRTVGDVPELWRELPHVIGRREPQSSTQRV